jgi:hypothetical protein
VIREVIHEMRDKKQQSIEVGEIVLWTSLDYPFTFVDPNRRKEFFESSLVLILKIVNDLYCEVLCLFPPGGRCPVVKHQITKNHLLKIKDISI